MSLHMSCEMQLPAWLDEFIDDWTDPLESIEQRMHLAVTLAAENVKHHTGGPFGAIVVEDVSNRLISVGLTWSLRWSFRWRMLRWSQSAWPRAPSVTGTSVPRAVRNW